MFQRIFLFVSFCCLLTGLSAQEIKTNLEKLQTTVTGDSLLVTGFKPKSSNQKFSVTMYNKNTLELIATYEKSIDPGAKSYFVERVGSSFRFTFYSSTSKVKYRISLDLALNEKFAGLPVEKDALPENEEESDDWTYSANYCNDYTYGSYMLDAQLSEITCYTLLDPVEGTYRIKWEKVFDSGENYQKVELLAIVDNTAYYFMVGNLTNNIQNLMAIDVATGKVRFTKQLNEQVKTDSVQAFGVSNLYTDGKSIYLGGTYLIQDPENPTPYVRINDDQSEHRGYDNVDLYLMYMADGYFLMSLDANSGEIQNVKLFESPSVDKTVDNRDYRAAVCTGIAPLNNGKMVAFFEQYSCITHIATDDPIRGGAFGMTADEFNPVTIKWSLDALTSVVFDKGMSDFTPTTTIWDEENTTYQLTDFDMFALNVQSEYPHDYVTIGDDGTYPHQFICDGVNWTFVIRADDEKSPDYLLKGNETDQKIVKLINSGILYPISPDTMVEQKDGESSTTIKIVKH